LVELTKKKEVKGKRTVCSRNVKKIGGPFLDKRPENPVKTGKRGGGKQPEGREKGYPEFPSGDALQNCSGGD